MPNWLGVIRGDQPLVISVPHAGLEIPEPYADAFVSLDLARCDADFCVDRLYAFAGALGATVIRTAISRTIVDVNRDPSGASLYPGMATTELCPTTTFDGTPLYKAGLPSAVEVAERRAAYFDPYHRALESEIGRLRARHARVVLYDAHSIRSRVPRLFEGELPQFNIGSFGGKSCDMRLAESIAAVCSSHGSTVVNGRFKGGWITRHYGAPEHGVHALQLELCQCTYMDEIAPFAYRTDLAARVQPLLRQMVAAAVEARPQG